MTSKPLLWSAFGAYDKANKPNLMSQIFAVLVAAQTFSNPGDKYPWLMCVLVILGAGWIGFNAYKAKSVIGLVLPAASLIWLNPLFGGNLLNSVAWFFFAQAALALLFGIAGYTFMRGTESAKKQ